MSQYLPDFVPLWVGLPMLLMHGGVLVWWFRNLRAPTRDRRGSDAYYYSPLVIPYGFTGFLFSVLAVAGWIAKVLP